MKSTIETLEGLRKINAAIDIMRDSEDAFEFYDLIEGLDRYNEKKLNDMFTIGKLNIDDLKVFRSFIESENKTQAALKHGCSLPWYNRLLFEVCEQVDSQGANV